MNTDKMIPKADLVPFAWYRGHCRNATIAMWYARHEKFLYIRHKFGGFFIEEIRHPDDEKHYDVFVPLEKL